MTSDLLENDAPGDEFTLLAIANEYGAKIFMVTASLGENFITEITPTVPQAYTL